MKRIYILASLLCPLALGGCDGFRNMFGLDHYSPNEWNTPEPSPGLILPPDFSNRPKLPQPTPGAPNPHIVPVSVKVKKTVLGDGEAEETHDPSSDGEQDLIEKASENQKITPDIRKKVDEEAQDDSSISGKIISKIQSWKKQAADNLSLDKKDEDGSDGKDDDDTDDKDEDGANDKDDAKIKGNEKAKGG